MAVPSIGVLTFHRCINYGSYWQARCLAEGLAEKFLGDPEATRVAAMQQLAMLAPILVGLAEQAGIAIPKAKR